MANPLPPGQRQIYDHFDDETESSYEEAGDPRGMFTGPIFAAICVIVGVATITAALYLFLYSLDDLAEAFLQYSKRDIGRFLGRLRGRGFLRYEELSGLYTRVPEHERDYEERPVEDEDEEPPRALDISLLVAGGLFLPIRLPCFIPGVMEHAPACQQWAASLGKPMTEELFLIEMKKNLALTLALLCAWASLLQTSVATKKAVLRAVASLMSVQNLWATFVAHGLASPEMLGELVVAAALMVAAILLTAPDAKAGKEK